MSKELQQYYIPLSIQKIHHEQYYRSRKSEAQGSSVQVNFNYNWSAQPSFQKPASLPHPHMDHQNEKKGEKNEIDETSQKSTKSLSSSISSNLAHAEGSTTTNDGSYTTASPTESLKNVEEDKMKEPLVSTTKQKKSIQVPLSNSRNTKKSKTSSNKNIKKIKIKLSKKRAKNRRHKTGVRGLCNHCKQECTPKQWRNIPDSDGKLRKVCNPCGLHFTGILKHHDGDKSLAIIIFERQEKEGKGLFRGKSYRD
ncbi:hypothetical protein DASC09_054450 [Saccharomycopsis crataegensis]|uniref:GATA-type domain-containing protein n=1 Tax=Saccharomycopsis crataegensis TaxID=43959 RepID=A0AAV5QVA9_9ASCO|nr:hypothetical protein DASC09_054450 [Saccharomycopsis crataegensis]